MRMAQEAGIRMQGSPEHESGGLGRKYPRVSTCSALLQGQPPPPFPMYGPLVNHPLTLEILAHVKAKLFSPELSNPWNIFPKLC